MVTTAGLAAAAIPTTVNAVRAAASGRILRISVDPLCVAVSIDDAIQDAELRFPP
jgi:hypothetical protein